MEMQELTNILLNSGVTAVMLIYFIWRDYKFMDTLKTTLVSLIDTVQGLKECISELKTFVLKKEDD